MTELNDLLKKAWSPDSKPSRSNLNKYEKCGDETIKLINDLNPSLVLDLGCGNNRYKNHIKNLIGIDLVDKGADIVGDISYLNFPNESVDACLCYGSINFGDENLINQQLQELFRVLKTGGIAVFRGNMNENHNASIYYGWNKEKINYWTDFFKISLLVHPVIIYRTTRQGIVNHQWQDRIAAKAGFNHRSIERLYWIWKK